jgi:hypothetical protein
MNTEDPLAQLRDIHLPEPISWWPLAPGWWLLAVVIIGVLFFSIRWLVKRRARNCYRKEARRVLADISALSPNDNLKQCQDILSLLRRTAKTAYPQLALESNLTPAMLDRLNQYCGHSVFDSSLQEQFATLLYQANPEISDSLRLQLTKATEQWIKKHRVDQRKHKKLPSKNETGGQHAIV